MKDPDLAAHVPSASTRSPAERRLDAFAALDNPKVLFLHPKTLVDSWPFPVDSLGEVVKAPSAVYPVLAATISHLPLRMEIFDGYVARERFADYKRRLAAADLLAITVMSPLKSLDTELTLRLARRLNPNVVVVLGGNQASSFPERWIEKGADFVVVGEGEAAFRSLVETLMSGGRTFDAVPNLAWRDGGRARRSPVQALQIALDDSPIPRWDLMDFRPYELGVGFRGHTATVEVSRGCPHRCDFCSINTFWNFKQRYKSVGRVCDELERLRDLGVRQVIFADDNFGQDHRHARALFEEMIRRDLRMGFGSFMRGDTVLRHPELIALAREAGMRFCLMGIETLDDAWLKDHRKGVRSDAVATYSEVFRILHRENGIFVIGLFINSPERAGAAAGRRVDGLVCNFHYSADLVALKGSGMYGRLEAEGAVGKDMFYHDWNLSSLLMPDGSVQKNTTSILDSFLSNFALRALVGGSAFSRRFRWRHLGVIAERLLCTTADDVRRYTIAKRTDLSLQARQDLMLATTLDDRFVARLARRRRWTAPLSLRNGLWSRRPRRPAA